MKLTELLDEILITRKRLDEALYEDPKHALVIDERFTGIAATYAPQLAKALQAVLELHEPDMCDEHHTTKPCNCGGGQCTDCWHPRPCPTVQAITNAMEASE